VAAIAAGVAVFNAVAGSLPAGKALPVAKARLKVGDVLDESKPVGPQDKEGVYLALATCATTGIMAF
jgi:hypothetical protein